MSFSSQWRERERGGEGPARACVFSSTSWHKQEETAASSVPHHLQILRYDINSPSCEDPHSKSNLSHPFFLTRFLQCFDIWNVLFSCKRCFHASMGTAVSKRKNLRNDAISSVAAKVRWVSAFINSFWVIHCMKPISSAFVRVASELCARCHWSYKTGILTLIHVRKERSVVIFGGADGSFWRYMLRIRVYLL